MPTMRRTGNAPEFLERRGGFYDRRYKRRQRIARTSDGKQATKKALGEGTAQSADSDRDRHRYVGSHRRASRPVVPSALYQIAISFDSRAPFKHCTKTSRVRHEKCRLE